MHGASSHPNPRNVASLRSRNQARFSCLISDSSLLLTAERRFAPTTVRYRRISVRYESEQVSAFIGIRTRLYDDGDWALGSEVCNPHRDADRRSLVCTYPVSESDHRDSLGRLGRKRQVFENLVEAGGVLPVWERTSLFLPTGSPDNGPGFGVDDQTGDELFEGEPLLSRVAELHRHSLFCPAKPDPLPCPAGFKAGLWTNSCQVCLCGATRGQKTGQGFPRSANSFKNSTR